MAARAVRSRRPRRARHRRRVRPGLRDRRGTGPRRRARRAERPPARDPRRGVREALRPRAFARDAAPFDVTDAAAVGAGVGPRSPASIGAVDILVNNAAVNQRKPLDAFSPEEWRALHAANLDGPFLVTRAVLPSMQARRRGKIINICSLASDLGRPNIVPYAASKGGLRMLTRALAVELAPHNVQVNGIAPGFFRTEMNAALIADRRILGVGRAPHAGGPLGRARRRSPAQRCFSHRPQPTTSPDTSFTSTGDFPRRISGASASRAPSCGDAARESRRGDTRRSRTSIVRRPRRERESRRAPDFARRKCGYNWSLQSGNGCGDADVPASHIRTRPESFRRPVEAQCHPTCPPARPPPLPPAPPFFRRRRTPFSRSPTARCFAVTRSARWVTRPARSCSTRR